MRGSHEFTENSGSISAVAKSAVGFASDFPFVAEVTVERNGEMVTAREGSYTKQGAVERARLAARDKLTAMKRSVGFAPESFYQRTTSRAAFGFGFA
jgi:hypothetical protein